MSFTRKKKASGHEYEVKGVRTPKGSRQKVVKYAGKAGSFVLGESRLGDRLGFPDKAYYEGVAKSSSFKVDTLETVYRLSNFLEMMNGDETLDKLVLRGGTAINLFYFDTPRLSVDIDLVYVGSLDRIETKDAMDRIAMGVAVLSDKLGYQLTSLRPYAQHNYKLFYQNIYGGKDHIKVEVNFMYRLPLLEVEERLIKCPFNNFKDVKVTVLRLEELFASKLAALVSRAYPRDIYDIYLLNKSKLRVNKQLLRKCFVFYASLEKDLSGWKREISLTEKDYSNSLKPVLGSDVPSREDVVVGAQSFLDEILKLSKNEERYVMELYKNGKCVPSLLFQEGEASPHLEQHPNILHLLHQRKAHKGRVGR